jgi:mannonate dehydratase
MKMTFRWYGKDDPVSLEKIRQIPNMSGIVSAVYDVPVGGVWPEADIRALKEQANANGLAFEVVESVPVHEEIKFGGPKAGAYIETFCENVRRLGKAGVKVVTYNFMPVFDWLRSELAKKLPDGSTVLAFDHDRMIALNPATSDFSLPGWDESYSRAQMKELLNLYRNVSEEKLWSNLKTFLAAVVPVAESSGVRLAIHPDDPPWPVFNLPRIITNAKNLQRLLGLVDSPANGITFCTGSLGANPNNNLPAMIRACGKRIYFAHVRNVKHTGPRCFEEAGHLSCCGSLDMYEIVRAFCEAGFDGYVRPDHGRMIWGETGRPGYGLYDRALGSMYLQGLWEAVEKNGASK